MGETASVPDRSPEPALSPVVFVPGYGHADRAWSLIGRHLDRAGFTDVGALDPVASRGDIVARAGRLRSHIEAVQAVTGCQKVHVVGHNVGGIVIRYYVQVLGGDESVDTAVTVGSPHAGSELIPVGLGPAAAQVRPGSNILRRLDESARPMNVRWISYFSEHDLFVAPATAGMLKHPLLRATNVLVSDHGHLSLMIPTATCRSIAQQLAAAEGIPGHGTPVSALPGGVVKLEDDRGTVPSPAAVASAKAVHPSNWGRGHSSKLMRLAGQHGA